MVRENSYIYCRTWIEKQCQGDKRHTAWHANESGLWAQSKKRKKRLQEFWPGVARNAPKVGVWAQVSGGKGLGGVALGWCSSSTGWRGVNSSAPNIPYIWVTLVPTSWCSGLNSSRDNIHLRTAGSSSSSPAGASLPAKVVAPVRSPHRNVWVPVSPHLDDTKYHQPYDLFFF